MDLHALLGDDADDLLNHTSKGIVKEDLHLPGPDFIDRCMVPTDRSPAVLRNLGSALRPRPAGRHRLRVDPARSTRASSTRPRHRSRRTRSTSIRPTSAELAIEGGCNAVASTFGVLGAVSRQYAHKIPFIVKLNHNELLTYPNKFDQIMFGSVKEAYDIGAVGVGATIYFGSEQSTRQIQEVSTAFKQAHDLGLFTVLWCYLRNSAFKTDGRDYHVAADLTGQANHLGVTIEADIIKQKLPENNGGYNALSGYGKTSKLVYDELTTDHPIDLCRWQVANCYMGRIGLINSGGESKGDSDLADRGQHRRDQQACRRAGPDLGAQGVPAADGRGRRAAARHPGRLPGRSPSPSPDRQPTSAALGAGPLVAPGHPGRGRRGRWPDRPGPPERATSPVNAGVPSLTRRQQQGRHEEKSPQSITTEVGET